MSARRWIAVALVGGPALAGCGGSTADSRGHPRPQNGLRRIQGPPVSQGGLLGQGRALFIKTGCGNCHTVAAAGTTGQLGPNFDTSERLDRVQIRTEIDNGANGMPSFQGRFTRAQERAVIDFIYRTMHPRG